MLIFLDARLAYLATPKTGTTALHGALRARADIIFHRRRKHFPARRFVSKVQPFIAKTFGVDLETFAVVREPVEQLRSWYSYRAREALAGDPRSTRDLSFDGFIDAVLDTTPPEYARVGDQLSFVSQRGEIVVDHLFDYAQPALLHRFLADRLGGEIDFETVNVSPKIDAALSPATEARLRCARAPEFALYAEVVATGGHWQRRR
jgi:hypothetical protein